MMLGLLYAKIQFQFLHKINMYGLNKIKFAKTKKNQGSKSEKFTEEVWWLEHREKEMKKPEEGVAAVLISTRKRKKQTI